MNQIVLIIFSLYFGYLIACDCGSGPIYGSNFAQGSVCPGCNYSKTYPKGYDYVDISHSFGQLVTQTVYQNGKVQGKCDQSKNCNKRINLNSNIPYTIEFTRQTTQNKNKTYARASPSAIPGKNMRDFSEVQTCNLPPIMNAEGDKQIGKVCSNCEYEYTISVNDGTFIEAEFNESVNIIINGCGETFNETSYSFYLFAEGFDDKFTECNLTISTDSENCANVKWLFVNNQGLGETEFDVLDNKLDNNLNELHEDLNELCNKTTEIEASLFDLWIKVFDETALFHDALYKLNAEIKVVIIVLNNLNNDLSNLQKDQKQTKNIAIAALIIALILVLIPIAFLSMKHKSTKSKREEYSEI
jgi:hypothetical protein